MKRDIRDLLLASTPFKHQTEKVAAAATVNQLRRFLRHHRALPLINNLLSYSFVKIVVAIGRLYQADVPAWNGQAFQRKMILRVVPELKPSCLCRLILQKVKS